MADEVIGELGRAARGGAIALFGLIIAAIFGFLVRAIVGRVYGPYQYGVYNLTFTVFTITLTFVMLGFQMGVQRQVSYFLAKKPERTKELITTAVLTVTGTSSVGLIFLELMRGKLPKYIGGGSLLPSLLSVLAIGLPITAVFNTLISTSQGFKRVREYVLYGKIAIPLLYFVSVVVVSEVIRSTIKSIVTTYVFVQATGLLLIVRDLKRAGILPGEVKFSPQLARVLVLFSVPLMLSNIVWFIMTWTDTLMLGHYLGSRIVGIYNAASPLARFIPVFLSAFTVIYSPIVTQLHAKGLVREINRFYTSITKWILLSTYPLFAILFLYPKPVIRTLFGTNYVEAGLSLMILALGFMLHSALGPNGLTIVSIGKPAQEMIGNVLGAILNVGINIALIPRYGMVGAAVATAISYGLANTYKQIILLKNNIKPFTKEYYKIITVGGAIIIMGHFIRTDSIWIAILLVGVYSILFYFLSLVMRTLDRTDIEILRIFAKKLNINIDKVLTILERFAKS
ncbi:flippase [Thermococcus sp.]